jgi:hypothetical protein
MQLPKQQDMTNMNIAEMMLTKAKQSGFQNTQVKNISTQPINGNEAAEAEVYGLMKGKNAALYYCIISKGDKQLMITAVSKRNIEEDIAEFKKLTHTITMK